ncbi:S9 family peptidase [Lewinella sp. W8]|uniref:S9 family peptidase n=1 Tax=Lewinella sp. W8 TaxID=2528208 RepID=UPI00106762E6|nr:S9 family peptidase [Lewinella sp. W8]MTB52314.1 prolyl oligopeptidase family serine peptidase [Lewinella sp. W8]
MLRLLSTLLFLVFSGTLMAQSSVFEPIDVFDLEYVSDPQIDPDGQRVIYVRNFKDIMTDRNLSNLWVVNFDGSDPRPLTSGAHNDYSPRWSPSGDRLVYLSTREGRPQIYLRWLDGSGTERRLTNLQQSPGNLSWSPDGRWLAFSMTVPGTTKPLSPRSGQPAGAAWADAPKFIDQMVYRADGAGFLKPGHQHIFLLSADGGHPRQLTSGDFDHGGNLSWTPDGKSIVFSANRHANHEEDPLNSAIYQIEVASGKIATVTDRQGPDNGPVVSPDGNMIAYTGFDDRLQGYQVNNLYVYDRKSKKARQLASDLDRDVSNLHWDDGGKGLYFQYDSEGNTYLAHITLDGKMTRLADNLGGLSLGRPYSGGTFSVAQGNFAFTYGTPEHPADLAVGFQENSSMRLTNVNEDLFSYKKLGEVEEIWFNSGADGRRVQGWLVKPPNFDPTKKYPFLLEIHGGPFTNYGSRFSAEIQLYAAAGYVVLYTNPRGSTSYGAEFGNLIHHNYPGEDYDDLMAGVDAVVAKGYVDPEQLFITGGSGGGVLTAWSIGKTDRFAAAVVAKPVINWYSFVLHADNPNFFYKYWFPGKPWEHQEHYMARSPISLVGNVTTPTLLLTGEQDYRTPMSETEQYYAALKLEGVPSGMVRIQESGHGIANKPSNLIAKVENILAWFARYRK